MDGNKFIDINKVAKTGNINKDIELAQEINNWFNNQNMIVNVAGTDPTFKDKFQATEMLQDIDTINSARYLDTVGPRYTDTPTSLKAKRDLKDWAKNNEKGVVPKDILQNLQGKGNN